MFYYLSQLRGVLPGFNIFRYITFRAAMAGLTTFLLCVIFGPFVIKRLKAMKIQEVAKKYLNPNQRLILEYLPEKNDE